MPTTKLALFATLLAASVAAHALDKVVFATNWKAQAAHRSEELV